MSHLTATFVGLALLLSLPQRAWADGWERHSVDADDLLRMKALHPDALPLFEQGEAAWREGHVDRAADLFRQAADMAPTSALAARRQCQALSELGKRAEAIAACGRATKIVNSTPTTRAAIGAAMSGTPNPVDIALALRAIETSKSLMPDQPWAVAAECDVAERLGDDTMLNACTRELERIAPGHYETQRKLAALEARRTPHFVWIGWLVLGGVLLGTAGHAAFKGLTSHFRLKRRSLVASSAAVVLVLGVSAPLQAYAQTDTPPGDAADDGERVKGFSKWEVNPKNPASTVPTPEQRDRDPLHFGYQLMDLLELAEAAENKGDLLGAAKFYEAIVKAVPIRGLGYRRACNLYKQAGMRDKAIEYCRRVLGAQDVQLEDHRRFAALLVMSNEMPNEMDVADLDDAVEHLKSQKEAAAQDVAAEMQCEMAVRLDDEARLRDCAVAIIPRKPNDKMTFYYQWALAMKQERFSDAEAFADKARKAGMKSEDVKRLHVATARESSIVARLRRHWQGLALGASGLVFVGGLGFLARFLVRRRPDRPDGPPTTSAAQA